VNLALRRFGLRNEARPSITLLIASSIVALVASVSYTGTRLWHFVEQTMFQQLNTCVDTDASASLAWLQEQPYRPSAEYAACVSSVHHAAIIEASLIVGLLVCGVLVVIVGMIEEFADEYLTVNGQPVFTTGPQAIRTGLGIAAILLAAAAVMIIFPVS
jgi:hypothetical protein